MRIVLEVNTLNNVIGPADNHYTPMELAEFLRDRLESFAVITRVNVLSADLSRGIYRE